MTKQNPIKPVEPGTWIAGTFRKQDLLPSFCRALVAYGSPKGADLYARIPRDPDAPAFFVGDADPWWSSVECDSLLEEVEDALNEHAPDGHYFGSHPGDGSDFGFWPVEQDEDEDEDTTVGKHDRQKELAQMQAIHARRGAEQAFDTVIDTLRSAIRQVEGYRDQAMMQEDDLSQVAAYCNWALHHLAANVQGNMRLDMLANAQANLLAAAAEAKQLARLEQDGPL